MDREHRAHREPTVSQKSHWCTPAKYGSYLFMLFFFGKPEATILSGKGLNTLFWKVSALATFSQHFIGCLS